MALFKVKVKYLLETEGIVEHDSLDEARSAIENPTDPLPIVTVPVTWYAQKDVYADDTNRKLELAEIVSLIES